MLHAEQVPAFSSGTRAQATLGKAARAPFDQLLLAGWLDWQDLHVHRECMLQSSCGGLSSVGHDPG